MHDNYLGVRPRWSLWEAALILAIILAVTFLIPLNDMKWFQELSAAISPNSPILGYLFWHALLKGGLFAVLVAIAARTIHGHSWSDLGLVTDRAVRYLRVGSGQGIVLFLTTTVISAFLFYILRLQAEPQDIMEVVMKAEGWRETLLSLSVTSLFAPVSEELYFRGFLYPALRRSMSRVPALLLANAVFGALHFDMVRFAVITAAGIWLTLLYEKSGSLLTSIAAHATWNTISIIIVLAL